MVNRDKIRDKIQIIKDNLSKLESIKKTGFEKFIEDPFMSDAAIRQLQVSIEAMLDISHHIISRKHLGTPKTYLETIKILTQAGIIPQQQLSTLIKMVKFRNRAVHLYDKMSGEEIHNIIQHHLTDFDNFINAIVQYINCTSQ